MTEKWNHVGREQFFGGKLGRDPKKIENHWYDSL